MEKVIIQSVWSDGKRHLKIQECFPRDKNKCNDEIYLRNQLKFPQDSTCYLLIKSIIQTILHCLEFEKDQKGGLILNCIGILDHPLSSFLNTFRSGSKIRPSQSLTIEGCSMNNLLSTELKLNHLAETLFLSYHDPLLEERVNIALNSGELDILCVIDLLKPDTVDEEFTISIYRTKRFFKPNEKIGITGFGLISPYGYGLSKFIENSHSQTNLQDVPPFLVPKSLAYKRSQWLNIAFNEALANSYFNEESLYSKRLGIIIVTKAGPVSKEVENIAPDWLGNRSKWFEDLFKRKLPHYQITAACASVFFAIRLAKDLLQNGCYQKIIIAGQENYNAFEKAGMEAVKAISCNFSKPFDTRRNGINLSEGAGVLILEKESHLIENGIKPHAWISNCSTIVNAEHPTKTDPETVCFVMKKALDAVADKRVDVVHAHATGTPQGDLAEAQAITELFKNRYLPIVSNKGAVGHPLYISGFFSLASSIAMLKKQETIITKGCEEIDANIGLNIVKCHPSKININSILVNNFGFFGNYSSLLLTSGR